MHDKPFSQACENNQNPILEVLRTIFIGPTRVLEIGSGTGQHAAYFCHQLRLLQWQPSDRAEHLSGIQAWRDWASKHWKIDNMATPLELDVNDLHWPVTGVDAVFTANTCHIMDWDSVRALIPKAAACLKDNAHLCLYGPFNYPDDQGHIRYTSPSNARFDAWLKQRDPRSGIRDFPALQELAQQAGLGRLQDHSMPANNRLLIWQKLPT